MFLRGLIPLVGFPSTVVYYERHGRMAGKSHYPLSKMLALGIIGEYVGKSYIEVKARPRYIISERTYTEAVSEPDG